MIMTDQPTPDLTEVIDITQLPGFENLHAGDGCEDPDCHGGFVAVDLSTEDGLEKGITLLEQWVMNAQILAHEVDGAEQDKIATDLVEYLATMPQTVVVGALMSISDTAAGMFLRLNELGELK